MKILVMEKFDGISSEIPLWNGRHPTLNHWTNRAVPVVNSTQGFYGHVFTGGGETNALSINCTLIPTLDPLKRYSFLLNGLRTLKVSDQDSNLGGNDIRRVLGIVFDTAHTTSKNGTFPFIGVTGDTGTVEYNLELVYKNGFVDIYVNGVLKANLPCSLSSTEVVFVQMDGNNSYGYGNRSKRGGPLLSLKEFIIVELEEGERKIGNVRLERLQVSTVSENLPTPEKITPINLANNTFSPLGEDSVAITVAKPTIVKNEKVIGVDYRVSAVGTIDGSQMRVKLNDGLTDIESKVVSLPMSHTRDSSCHIVQAVNGGDLPSDYDTYSIVLEATEDES